MAEANGSSSKRKWAAKNVTFEEMPLLVIAWLWLYDYCHHLRDIRVNTQFYEPMRQKKSFVSPFHWNANIYLLVEADYSKATSRYSFGSVLKNSTKLSWLYFIAMHLCASYALSRTLVWNCDILSCISHGILNASLK